MEHLIQEARRGNPDAFTQLMKLQMQSMYKTAGAVLYNDEDAADAIADTILICWEKLWQLKQEKYFRTWMMRILINQCNEILRKRKKLAYLEDIPETPACDTEYENAEWKEALRSLNEKYRLILTLYYVEGFQTKEIGQMLGMEDSTVRTRLARGRKQLAKEFR